MCLFCFEDLDTTEYLCTVVDRLFDIFNSKSPRAKGFKASLSLQRLNGQHTFLEETGRMLLNLTTKDGKLKLCESRRLMGIIGFAANIKSLQYLAESILSEPVAGKPILYLLTYKLSQDHLEIMFACMRKAGGFNNNPSARQFASTFKKLMFRSGVALTPSDNANIITQDETSLIAPCVPGNGIEDNIDGLDIYNIESVLFEDAMTDHSYSSAAMRLSPFIENILVYIAGWVVRSVAKRLRCVDCVDVLTQDARVGVNGGLLLELKNNGGLLYASDDVVTIIRMAENVLRSSVDFKNPCRSNRGGLFCLKLEMQVLSKLANSRLFISKHQHFMDISHGCEGHYLSLIRLICKCFVDVRLHHVTHMANIARQREIVRQTNNKLTLFRNQ